MQTRIPITEFAPAERVPIDVIQRQASAVANLPLTTQLLDSVLNYVFVLNPQRQIVFASRNLAQLAPGRDHAAILGMRPGEVLGCIHADAHEGGCGTSAYCSQCGAALAILASLAGQPDLREFRLTRLVNCGEESLDLLVYASPFRINGETYALLAVTDASHEKRRRTLEKVFFHDLLNYATGLEGLATVLADNAPPQIQRDAEVLRGGLREMIEQILGQRDLAAAETGDLAVSLVPVHSATILKEVVRMYEAHSLAKDRRVRLDAETASVRFKSDPALLRRVLGNLLKNALEAVGPGQVVTAGCDDEGEQVRFWVHNPGEIPRQVQLQIFNRSFSTKAADRGLGTYSVKLLTQRYLHGKVGFVSDATQGTEFFIVLPKDPDP